MIKPLQRMVGPYSKPIKVTPLSQMIPHRVSDDYSTGKAFNGIVPFSPDMLRLMEIEGDSYIVPKKQIHNLVNASDIDDWSHLFKKLNLLLGNMMKLLSNIRKQEYYKITYLKSEEKEIQRRHNIMKEKLLDRSTEQEEVEAKTPMTDYEKIEQFKKSLGLLGFTAAATAAAGLPPPGAELDAATLAQVRASGADLIAAAHLATLESGPAQQVADVMQVILNRAKGQSGGIPAVITLSEAFTPYSAAIYGRSIDKYAERHYGHLKVSKAEIFQLASQPNGLQALTDRFGAGNPAIAAQVLMDIKSNGPLITSSRQFVGGAQYFTGYRQPGSRRRPDGGNYFRDSYAAGGIVIPELFDRHRIEYDTERKSTLLSNFIVDKPTIINTKDVGEPLVIIPLGRPIGRSILKILFERPFKMIEKAFGQTQEQERSEVNPQTPIQNSQTQINRTSIPESTTETGTTIPPSYSASTESKNSIVSIPKEILSSETSSTIDMNVLNKITENILPILDKIMQQKTRIDNVSQSVSDMFETEVFLLTQDITIIEE